MFNRKFHIFLAIFTGLIILLGMRFDFGNGAKSLFGLIGLSSFDMFLVWSSIIFSLAVTAIVVTMTKRISQQFYFLMFNGHYDVAEAFLLNFHKQNNNLFFSQYAFLAFSKGEISILESLSGADSNALKGKKLIATCYKCLYEYVHDSKNTVDYLVILSALQNKLRKNQNMIFLFCALASIERNEFLKAEQFIGLIKPTFYFPSLKEVINKIQAKINENKKL